MENKQEIAKSIERKSVIKRFFLFGKLGNGTPNEAVLLWLAVVPFCDYITSGLLVLLIAGAILIKKELRNEAFSDKRAVIVCAAITGWSLLVSVIARNYEGMAISVGIFCTLLSLCYTKNAITEKTFRKITVILAYGSVVAFFCALIQKFVIFSDGDQYRPTAGAFNANYFGTLIISVALMSLIRLTDKEVTRAEHEWYDPTKIFWSGILCVNILSLLICESRSSLLAFMACAIGVFFLRKMYLICGAAVVGGGAVWAVGWIRPDIFSWTNSLSFIIRERSVIWKEALGSFLSSWYTVIFGRGPMTYHHVMQDEGLFVANHSHNFIIDTFLNVGVVGFAMYAVFLVLTIKHIINKKKAKDTTAAIFTVIMLCEIMVQGIADVTLMWHQCAVCLLLLSAAKYKKQDKIG